MQYDQIFCAFQNFSTIFPVVLQIEKFTLIGGLTSRHPLFTIYLKYWTYLQNILTIWNNSV